MSNYSEIKTGNSLIKIEDYNVPGDFAGFMEVSIPEGTKTLKVMMSDCQFPATTDLNYFLSCDGGANFNVYIKSWYADADTGASSPTWSPSAQYVSSSPFNCGLIGKNIRQGTGQDTGMSGELTLYGLQGEGVKSAVAFTHRRTGLSTHETSTIYSRVMDNQNPAREIDTLRIIASNGSTNSGSGFSFDRASIQVYAFR
jgi:hypothetical protein